MGFEQLMLDAKCYREDSEFQFSGPKILVVGCGGAGCNSVTRLSRIGVYGAQTTAINTDKIHLDKVIADTKMLLGKKVTRGLGTGGRPEVGERCAELAKDEIAEIVKDADMTFITVGMGGGTGTGVAPMVAELAKEQGSIVVGIATTPFAAERGRQKRARAGLEKLRKHADSVIVLDNNRLLDMVPQLPIDQAFSVMDQLISEIIKSVTEAITVPSMINLDYADVKTIMSTGETATVLYAENSEREPEQVVMEALNNPLLEVDYTGATGALIHLTAGPRLTLKTAYSVLEGITYQLDDNANVILGARVDQEYEGSIKLMAIMTGVKSPHLLSSTVGLEVMDNVGVEQVTLTV